ncbi:unnamed protein product, partial [Choristocarpus tenellus]
MFHVGAIAWRHTCARRLQSLARGVAARSLFRRLLRRVNHARRAQFLAAEAADHASRLAEAMEQQEDSIDRLFNELDRGLAYSRKVFGLEAEGGAATEAETEPQSKWEEILCSAAKRREEECPICMCHMTLTREASLRQGEQVGVLLSCSHMFHAACLSAFEDFNILEVHVCPVCRQEYE